MTIQEKYPKSNSFYDILTRYYNFNVENLDGRKVLNFTTHLTKKLKRLNGVPIIYKMLKDCDQISLEEFEKEVSIWKLQN